MANYSYDLNGPTNIDLFKEYLNLKMFAVVSLQRGLLQEFRFA